MPQSLERQKPSMIFAISLMTGSTYVPTLLMGLSKSKRLNSESFPTSLPYKEAAGHTSWLLPKIFSC